MIRTKIIEAHREAGRNEAPDVLASALAWAANAAGRAGRGDLQAALLYAYHDLTTPETAPPRGARRAKGKRFDDARAEGECEGAGAQH